MRFALGCALTILVANHVQASDTDRAEAAAVRSEAAAIKAEAAADRVDAATLRLEKLIDSLDQQLNAPHRTKRPTR